MKIIPKTLSSKLRAYSLCAGAIGGFNQASAQIIYMDIDPDIHAGYDFDQEWFTLNMNADAFSDLKITGFHDT